MGFDADRLNTLIHNDPRQCTRVLENVLNYDNSTIVRIFCIQRARFKKLSVWVPYALSQNHKNQRVTIYASVLARHRISCEQHRPFLSCIVTGNDKWCLYVISHLKPTTYRSKYHKPIEDLHSF